MKTVLFIRHGATAGNLQRRYIGRTDEPLCELGREQAASLADQALTCDWLFVSPMTRTRQTAELAFPGQDQIPVPDLQETDFGIFEARTADELSGSEAYQAWVDANCETPIPGGEAVADFKIRCIRAFLAAMDRVSEGQSAAFVMHGGCIMAICEALARPRRDFYSYHIANGQYLTAHWDGEALKLL